MIYFVQETGLFRNRVKIGFTDNIKGRMPGLRGGSPSNLKLLTVLPGDMQIEISYHERFEKYRLHGEWFRFGLRLRLFIWANQFKPFILDKPKQENDIEVPKEDYKAKIQNMPSDDEAAIIQAFINIRTSDKFSWNKVVKLAFGENKSGEFYHAKIKSILDKFGIDYSTELQEE